MLLLIIASSFAEIASIGAILPFLAVLTVPEGIFNHPAAQYIIRTLEIKSPDQLLLPITIGFGLVALLSGITRLALLWANARLSFAMGTDIGISIYQRTLYQSYASHISRNTSEVIDGVSIKVSGVIYGVLLQSLTLVSATFILIAILATLFYLDPITAFSAFSGFALIYGVIILLTRKRLAANSRNIANGSTQVIKALQEGLGGIRDILIDGTQPAYCSAYRKADIAMRGAQASTAFIGNSPRYAVESLGMVLIASLAYLLTQQPNGLERAVPLLGAMALGAQRMLPALQQAYNAWISINGSRDSLEDVLHLLSQPLPIHLDESERKPIHFTKSIEFKNVKFKYQPLEKNVVDGVDLVIAKGSRTGFIGSTGAGKSTLVDIFMGLLHPTEGQIKIDGEKLDESNYRAWQRHIAHVPQTIYLSDSTIAENIAFGVSKDHIDYKRVRDAAQRAQISEFVETLPERYETQTGERGVRLSGGQRQRIGIARALYKEADVIIFDEATSALDSFTEQSVMRTIEALGRDITLLIIAHRLTTLKSCNQLVKIEHGKIVQVGRYDELIQVEE